MRTIKVFDAKNYTDDMRVLEKYAVRAIIIKDGKIAMQKAKSGYFKILGGGVEGDEDYSHAIAREVQEEAGLIVIPESIKEIGEIVEIRQDIFDEDIKYICHSIFMFCDVKEEKTKVALTASEIREGFELAWATPEEIIKANKGIVDKPWLDRDTFFIQCLMDGTVES